MSKRIESAGYVLRSNEIINKLFEERVDRKRPRGQPIQRWIIRVNDDLNNFHREMRIENCIERFRWKTVVGAAKVLQEL